MTRSSKAQCWAKLSRAGRILKRTRRLKTIFGAGDESFPTNFRHQLCIVAQRTESQATSVVFLALFFSKVECAVWLRTRRSLMRLCRFE